MRHLLKKLSSFTLKTSYETKINNANKIFIKTVGKLKKVRIQIGTEVMKNETEITKLNKKNEILCELSRKTSEQIDQYSKFIV